MSGAVARLRVLIVATLVLAAGVATWAIARTSGHRDGGASPASTAHGTGPVTAAGGTVRRTRPTAARTGARPLGVGGRWRLIFDEEFNGGRLNLRRWQPNWLGAHSTAVTASPNSDDINCVLPGQATVGGGALALTTAQRPCRAGDGTTYRYASGLVTTRRSFHFTYGYVEARVFLPSRGGHLVNFPAVWADGDHWPRTGELDVMEVLSDCGPGLGYHFHSPAGAPGGCAAVRHPGGWHTVGADWRPGHVTVYYDGRRVGQISSGITGAPMYLILDNNVDPTRGGPSVAGARMLVDYVRVWQHP